MDAHLSQMLRSYRIGSVYTFNFSALAYEGGQSSPFLPGFPTSAVLRLLGP